MRKVGHHHLDNVCNFLHALLHVQHRHPCLPVIACHLLPGNPLCVTRALGVRDNVQVQRNCRVLEEALHQQLVLLLQDLRLLCVNHKQIVDRPRRPQSLFAGEHKVILLVLLCLFCVKDCGHGHGVVHQEQAFTLCTAIWTEGGRASSAAAVAAATVEQSGKHVIGPGEDVIVGVEDEQEPTDNDEHQQDLVH